METTPNLNSARFVTPPPQPGAIPFLRSPVCPGAAMVLRELEPALFVHVCPRSSGMWIPLQSYLLWKSQPRHETEDGPTVETREPADDSRRPTLICPESGRLLIRYKVGHGLPFHIEVSPETGGVWLDAGEWEALKSKGLHLELNAISTVSYQRKIRTEEHEEAVARTFRQRIGEDGFEKAAAFKQWLTSHPRRRHIRSFLLYDIRDEDE
jgi:Zn-finger nucleic acid-binding protein